VSYYLVLDDDREFQEVRGPYRNKDDLIEALNQSFGFTVFERKSDAKEYIES